MAHGILVPRPGIEPVLHGSRSVDSFFFFSFYGSQLFFKKLINFYFWLYWSFIAVCGLSLVVEPGLLVVVASLAVGHST